MKYIQRLAEAELQRKLNSSGWVLVSGPKFCGKSTMCDKYASTAVALKTTNEIQLAQADPNELLKGDNPHLIDEWQKVPELWDIIRDDLDKDYQFGKYILTGSTTPIDESKIQHSGAGRITTMSLKPFSLFESGESSGEISIGELFRNPELNINTVFNQNNNISLSDIAYLLCRGGWPVSLLAQKEYSIDVTKNYYEGLFRIENESDEFAEFLKNKDVELLKTVLKSYARNISTQSKITSMTKDIRESGVRSSLDEDTFNSYANILKRLFIIYDLPAWNFNLRTSITVRKAPTHHFVDTSIAAAALDINPSDLLNDMKSFGYFFEDFAVRDLSIYAQASGATLKHYRDSSGQEVDAIIELKNGKYAAVEIKIASELNIQEGIKSLNSFEKKMLDNGYDKPVFKMVLVSHGASYKTEDNVIVVPINMLKD